MTRLVGPDSDPLAQQGSSSADQWPQELLSALRSLSAGEVQDWLACNRGFVEGLLEKQVRDPEFRALIDPTRITVEPGTDPETLDWDAAEANGLDETVTAMTPDIAAAIPKIAAALEGKLGADPLTAYRQILEALAQILTDDPECSRARALPALLADAQRAADAAAGSVPAALTPAETLATLAALKTDYIRRDAIREGADPELLAPLKPGSDQRKAQSAAWQTPTAVTTPPASAIGLGRMEGRLQRLRRETQNALVADALAQTPEAEISQRRANSRSRRSAEAGGSESESACDPIQPPGVLEAEVDVSIEELALERLEWARLADARGGGRLTQRQLLLLAAAGDGLPIAEAARLLRITPDAARQDIRRARKAARAILGR